MPGLLTVFKSKKWFATNRPKPDGRTYTPNLIVKASPPFGSDRLSISEQRLTLGGFTGFKVDSHESRKSWKAP